MGCRDLSPGYLRTESALMISTLLDQCQSVPYCFLPPKKSFKSPPHCCLSDMPLSLEADVVLIFYPGVLGEERCECMLTGQMQLQTL